MSHYGTVVLALMEVLLANLYYILYIRQDDNYNYGNFTKTFFSSANI